MKKKNIVLKTLFAGATLPSFTYVADNFIISDTSIVKKINETNLVNTKDKPNVIIISHQNLMKILHSGKLSEHIVNKIDQKITDLAFQWSKKYKGLQVRI